MHLFCALSGAAGCGAPRHSACASAIPSLPTVARPSRCSAVKCSFARYRLRSVAPQSRSLFMTFLSPFSKRSRCRTYIIIKPMEHEQGGRNAWLQLRRRAIEHAASSCRRAKSLHLGAPRRERDYDKLLAWSSPRRGAQGGVCRAELIAELNQAGIVSDFAEARQFGARDS